MHGSGEGVVVESVSMRYGTVKALDGVSLVVRKGTIFGIIGSDGAGKSTLLRLVAGMEKPHEGRVLVGGIDTATGRIRREGLVGYMPQRFGLYQDLSVVENMDFFLDVIGVRGQDRKRRKSTYLGFSGLEPFSDRLAGNLSGGMKQKLALACVLLTEPSCLVLDEPTNGVDPVSRREFWDILVHMRERGMAVVVATSYPEEGDLCDEVAFMHRSRIVKAGDPASFKGSHPSIEAAMVALLETMEEGSSP